MGTSFSGYIFPVYQSEEGHSFTPFPYARPVTLGNEMTSPHQQTQGTLIHFHPSGVSPIGAFTHYGFHPLGRPPIRAAHCLIILIFVMHPNLSLIFYFAV